MSTPPKINISEILSGLDKKFVIDSIRSDRANGDIGLTEKTLLERRFWKWVEKRGEDECWPWTGYVNSLGYGIFQVCNRPLRASRIMFVITHHREPNGLICHHCDNPPCVNPNHFFEGTDADNHDDCVAKGRKGWGMLCGEKSPRAKLTNEQVMAIRRLRAEGELVSRIARKFNVSEPAIDRIAKRQTWKHL